MVNKKWAVGSDQYVKRPALQSKKADGHSQRPTSPQRTGRVVWDRNKLELGFISHSTTERELFRFVKALPEFIWNAAALEGNTYTLPQIVTLLDGVTIEGKRIDEAIQILDLNEALSTMVEKVRSGTFSLDRKTSNEIHGIVARNEALDSGMFRGEGVVRGGGAVQLSTGTSVTGDEHGPEGSALLDQWSELAAALSNLDDPRERAVGYFASAARSQFYFDGNKRTARVMMAGELMTHGHEGIGVPYSRLGGFNQALDELFQTDEATNLINFVASCGTGELDQ